MNPVDVLARPARWYQCGGCGVRWHGTDQTCWFCETSERTELSHQPHLNRNTAARMVPPDLDVA